MVIAVFTSIPPADSPTIMSQYSKYFQTESQCEMAANKAEHKEHWQVASGEVTITSFCRELKHGSK